MSLYGVIGDAHQGFKAYDSTRRTEECIWVLEKAMELLYNEGIRVFYYVGDLLDDTVWPNWVEKRVQRLFRIYPDVKHIILGGNHDSTKTYSSVSALDVLAERDNVVIINNFKPEEFVVDGVSVLAIPHMKSQREFKEAVMAIKGAHDICLLHAMVYSKLALGPNDLNIDEEMMDHLTRHCARTWIGHQHTPAILSDYAVIPGSTMELNFGELGPRYVYSVDTDTNEMNLHQLPQPRGLERIDVCWSGVNDLLDHLFNLDVNTIYKMVVNSIPASEYSTCVAAIDSVCRGFEGDLIYDLIKVGHEEVNIKTIDAGFDLKHEFTLFCEDNNYDHDNLCGSLLDAIAAVAAEEEDMSL